MRAPWQGRSELRLTAAGLLLIVLAALAWATRPAERVADRNGVLRQSTVATLTPGLAACQAETLPEGAGRMRVPATIRDGAVRARAVLTVDGRRAEGAWAESVAAQLVVPLPQGGPRAGELCIESEGPGAADLVGQATGEADRLRLGDGQGAGLMRIDYLYGDGPRSLWSGTLGALPERIAAANGSAWAPWVAGLGLTLALAGLFTLLAGRRELLAVAVLAFGSAATWSGLMPMFQASDEPAHAGYVMVFAELGHPPRDRRNTGELPEEMGCWAAVTRFDLARFHEPERPPWKRALEDPCAGRERRQDAAQYQAAQPPAYYALAMGGYQVASALDRPLPDRLLLARLVSALLAALTVLFAFVCVREALPASPWAARAGAVAAGLQPVMMFNHGMINSDALLFAVSAALAAVLARCWRRGLTMRRALLIGALLGLGAVTKITFVLVVPLAAAVQLLVWLRRRELPLRRRAGLLAASWGLALVPPALYVLLGAAIFESDVQDEAGISPPVREDKVRMLAYVWQTFLPRLPFMEDVFAGKRLPVIDAMIIGPTTRLGWWDDYGIGGPFATLIPLGAIALVVFAAFTAARRRHWRLALVVCAAVSAGYAALLVAALYIPHTFQVQGRYLGVLTPVWALAAGVAVTALRPRRQALAAAMLAVVMLGWSALALEATLSRWYL